MNLGPVFFVLGMILVFTADVETTQYFTGWVFGALALSTGAGLDGVPGTIVTSLGVVFVVLNPQTLVPKPTEIPCKNGNVRIINGQSICICIPPYKGAECDECNIGAIIESGSNENKDAVCKTCKHMYAFPYCANLLPGYASETTCNERFEPSCYVEGKSYSRISMEHTYGEFAPGIRKFFISLDENTCQNMEGVWDPETLTKKKGVVYCDKCKGNRAGRYCCEDGKTGPKCTRNITTCTAMLDLGATLTPNAFPVAYTLVEPEKCFPLDNSTCSCGGDFIGDIACASNFCDGGLCASVARSPPYEERCGCEYGVGPDCEVPPCYGGTRMYNGAAICSCNADYSDTHEACGVATDLDTCYPGLFGNECIECQCTKQVKPEIQECQKNIYDEFKKDLATGKLNECVETGICTEDPNDCGGNANVPARCKTWVDMSTFETLLFDGYKCSNVIKDECLVGLPCS